MTLETIHHKETRNYYALLKQLNHYFDGSEIAFLPERKQQLLMEYIRYNCRTEETIREAMDKSDINPGNTTDSIVAEITENLGQIAALKDIEDQAQAKGYTYSLNRAMAYQLANLENVLHIDKGKNNSGLSRADLLELEELKSQLLG